MKESGRRAHQYESAVLDLVEAGVLQHRVGESFGGVIVDLDDHDQHKGTVTIQEPAIEARVTGDATLPLGTDVRVRLSQADVASRAVGFTLEAGAAGPGPGPDGGARPAPTSPD
jgi:hypothetical protein